MILTNKIITRESSISEKLSRSFFENTEHILAFENDYYEKCLD